MDLADGRREVRLEPGDAEVVTALIRACEAHDGGVPERTTEDMQTIWARPSFVPATAAVGVRDGAFGAWEDRSGTSYEHVGMDPRGTYLQLARALP